MSFQIQSSPGFGGVIGQGLSGGLQQLGQRQQKINEAERLRQALSQLSPEQVQDPRTLFAALAENPEVAQAIYKGQIEQEKATHKEPFGGITGQPTPPAVSQSISQVVRENPNASSDELALKLDEAGVPRAYSNSFIENRRRQEEARAAKEGKVESQIRKEVAPIKQKIAEKANAAEDAIKRKEELLKQINTGNLNDPTYAAVLESLPLKLGERFLSDDTVSYRSSLIDEFGDLRQLFQGQTRTKELDILEKKMPGIYLTDSQKKKIIEARINSLEADVLKAQVAAEVEDEKPGLGILQFEREVNKKLRPLLKELSERTIGEISDVIDEAEKHKSYELDINRPEDNQVMRQILKEANGNPDKALKIAKEKGYKIKGA